MAKCPSAASDNLDVARYACDYLLCSWTFIRRQINKLFLDNSLKSKKADQKLAGFFCLDKKTAPKIKKAILKVLSYFYMLL